MTFLGCRVEPPLLASSKQAACAKLEKSELGCWFAILFIFDG